MNKTEYYRQWNKEHPDKIKQYQKKYQQNNRKKINNMLITRRKEVAKELKEQGMIYTYLHKTAREEKMIKSLSKKINITETEAKELLIKNNWNYKKLTNK